MVFMIFKMNINARQCLDFGLLLSTFLFFVAKCKNVALSGYLTAQIVKKSRNIATRIDGITNYLKKILLCDSFDVGVNENA